MTARANCCLIGAGRIGQCYAQAIKESEVVTLTAVVDAQQSAAQSIADQFDAVPFRSLQAFLNSSCDADFAVVCVPPNLHHGIVMECLDGGLHVLCEKPFCIAVSDAEEMLRAAARSNRLLTMASKFRYVPDVIEARKIIHSDLLGEIVLFENVFATRIDMSERWNSDPRISGGGVLIDNGSHALDLARYLFGPMTEIQVLEGKRVQNLCVEDTVRINLRTADHVLGNIDLSWSVNKGQDSYLTVHGSKGTLVVGWTESKYHLHADARWTPFGGGYCKIDALRGQVSNFAKAIGNEEELLIAATDALASVQSVEAAYRSMRGFLWTTIPGVNVRPLRRDHAPANGQVSSA